MCFCKHHPKTNEAGLCRFSARTVTHTHTHTIEAEDQAQTTYSLYFVSIKIRSACCYGKCLVLSIFCLSLSLHLQLFSALFLLHDFFLLHTQTKCIISSNGIYCTCLDAAHKASVLFLYCFCDAAVIAACFLSVFFLKPMAIIPHVIIVREMENETPV